MQNKQMDRLGSTFYPTLSKVPSKGCGYNAMLFARRGHGAESDAEGVAPNNPIRYDRSMCRVVSGNTLRDGWSH